MADNRKNCVLCGRMCRRLADSRKISTKEKLLNFAKFTASFLLGKVKELIWKKNKQSVLLQNVPCNIHKTAKMVGEYNGTKPLLYTEKMAGSVSASLGFVQEGKYFIPNTAIREDIRDITRKPQQRVLAVFRKTVRQRLYTEITYLAKGKMPELTEIKKLVVGVGLQRESLDELQKRALEKAVYPTR